MRAPKQNCPRCNAEQSFRPQRRDAKNAKPGVIEVYIRCTVCRWEHLLRQSTTEIELLRAREIKLAQQANREETRHGVVQGSTRKLLDAVRGRMSSLRREYEIA